MVTAVPTRFAQARAMWCRGATTDHILIGSARPRLHQDHLALHGIGHMLFGHVGRPAVSQAIESVLGETDLAQLRRSLKRVVYTYGEERQAEVFATRVQQLTGGWVARYPAPASHALPLERLSAALEYHPRRAGR